MILSSEAVALISRVRDMYATPTNMSVRPILDKDQVFIVIRGLFVVSNLGSTFVFVWIWLFAVILVHPPHLNPHPIHLLIRLCQTRS